MKTIISKLKKGDRFKFNDMIHVVRQKYNDWRKNDEPYLRTECDQYFWHDELEVELLP